METKHVNLRFCERLTRCLGRRSSSIVCNEQIELARVSWSRVGKRQHQSKATGLASQYVTKPRLWGPRGPVCRKSHPPKASRHGGSRQPITTRAESFDALFGFLGYACSSRAAGRSAGQVGILEQGRLLTRSAGPRTCGTGEGVRGPGLRLWRARAKAVVTGM